MNRGFWVTIGIIIGFGIMILIQSKPKQYEPENVPVAILPFKDGWNVVVQGKTYYIPPHFKTEQPVP